MLTARVNPTYLAICHALSSGNDFQATSCEHYVAFLQRSLAKLLQPTNICMQDPLRGPLSQFLTLNLTVRNFSNYSTFKITLNTVVFLQLPAPSIYGLRTIGPLPLTVYWHLIYTEAFMIRKRSVNLSDKMITKKIKK
jgi:hypothetical protein